MRDFRRSSAGHALFNLLTRSALGLSLQVVIFVKSVPRAVTLDKLLCECNFPSITIHSKLSQAER